MISTIIYLLSKNISNLENGFMQRPKRKRLKQDVTLLEVSISGCMYSRLLLVKS